MVLEDDKLKEKSEVTVVDLTEKRKNLEIQTISFGLIRIRYFRLKDHFNIPTILKIENNREFSQKLVFNQIIEPSLIFEDFKKIPDEELKEIIRKIVAYEKGLNEYFIEKPDIDFFDNFKGSVKDYFDNSEQKMRDALAPVLSSLHTVQHDFLQNFKPIVFPVLPAIPVFSFPSLPKMVDLPQISQLYEITEGLQKQFQITTDNIQQIWTPQVQLWQSFAEQNQKIFENFTKPFERFQETLKEIKITFDQANKILKKYKWFISPSLPIGFFGEIVRIHRGRKKGRQHKINRLFVGYFTNNNYEELITIVEDWKDNPLFKPRMKIFRDCVKILQNSKGKYNPSNVVLPTLIAQIDGILADYVEMKGITPNGRRWKDSSGKTINNRDEGYKILSSSQAYIAELPNYILLEILFQNAWRGQELNIPSTFSRHKIMHGEYITYGRIENTIRAFLILDFLNYLE